MPMANVCGVGLMGGTLTMPSAEGLSSQYGFLSGSQERLRGSGLGGARCWVLRDRAGLSGSWLFGVRRFLQAHADGLCGLGVGAVRILRTTQWTRAS